MILDRLTGQLSGNLGFEYTNPGPCFTWLGEDELLGVYAGNPSTEALPTVGVWRLTPASSELLEEAASFSLQTRPQHA